MANQLKMAEIDAILALHRRHWSSHRGHDEYPGAAPERGGIS
jgi:hypothetical protein